jgi:putative addiction module killer protein
VLLLRYYLMAGGQSPFESWFSDLDAAAEPRCRLRWCGWSRETPRRERRREGVLEYRIDWRPGFRVYLGRDDETLVILLTGSTKQRQQRDIERAKELWADYKRRRRPPPR